MIARLWPIPRYVLTELSRIVRIHEDTPKVVAFVGSEGQAGFLPQGTAFFVSRFYKDHHFTFLVTADHVIEQIAGDTISVRLNRRSGEDASTIRVLKSNKITGIDRTLDLAMFPIGPNHDVYDFFVLELDRAGHDQIVKDIWSPFLGDEVVTVGLYTSHYGRLKNIPVCRIGNIAMLPDEPVLTGRGYLKAYLIEVRSIAGLSGSPVFLNIPQTKVENGKLRLLQTSTIGMFPIGMMLGYHLLASAEDQIPVPQLQGHEAGAPSLDDRQTGFGVALPISHITDVLEGEPMKRSMDAALDDAKKRSGYKEAGVNLPAG